ncbi:MAG: TIM barrel protein [Planctomycetota bacterium]|nr:TIM barrel protein [Planctomycetota bacterium]
MQRRDFLKVTTGSAAGLALAGCSTPNDEPRAGDGGGVDTTPQPEAEQPVEAVELLYTISLAQWSLHRALKGGEMDNLDFPRVARERFGIDAVEYVNQFFLDKPRDKAYLADLRTRCEDQGVESLLIMCDGLGELGNPHAGRRNEAVNNHKPWVGAARALGCHSIRVNAASEGTFAEQQKLAADGLRKLAEYAAGAGLSVIVENHGGLSSNGAWLAGVMELADHPGLGTLPDFGNFCLDWSRRDEPDAWYDRYLGVSEMMPYARAVSAKSHDFDAAGNEVNTDFRRMMRIVTEAGYRGRIGIEYEGKGLSEDEGILATRRLLERVRDELSA